MINRIIAFFFGLNLVKVFKSTGFGLKSTINSLSIIPDLSPGLFNGLRIGL